MASSLNPARRGRLGRRVLFTVAAAVGVVLAPLPALAAPEESTTSTDATATEAAEPTTAAEAAALVAARGHDLEVLTEQYNDAREQLATAQVDAAAANEQVAAADAAVTTARAQVIEVARSAYTGESLSTLQAMLSSDSADEMLDRVGTLDTIAHHNNEVLAAAQEATEQADAAKAAAEKSTADAQALVDQVAAQQDELNTEIADYQAQYDRLSAEEKAAAEAAAATVDDRSDQTASRADRSTSDAGSSSSSASTTVVAGSGAAATAVSTALAQLGKPYVWAAAGPNSFDCSGLVQYAYAAAGISLPHSSSAQARMGTAVTRDQLQPGDIIAFYSPVSHVGIYIGNGQMVHAPTSGDVVKVTSIDAMGSITAMRRIG